MTAPTSRRRPTCSTGLRELRRRTAERGAALHGWAVFLHHTTLGLAHPDVRAYAVAPARSVARAGVDAVVAESLRYATFGHGYHHERSFVSLGALEEFLLGLCFCPYRAERAEAAGVDADAARTEAARVDGADPGPTGLPQSADLLPPMDLPRP